MELLLCLAQIALTAYKETIQQSINLPLETVNHEPDLLSCKISWRIYILIWQINYCASLSLRFRLAISESP